MNILIKYHSLSGNTKETANLIGNYVREQGHNAFVSHIAKQENPDYYDLLFIGCFTWGNGELPIEMKDYLRWLLKENNFSLPNVSLFGTGDTQWTYYCRAVDEMKYHISKYTKVLSTLKIEQHPINQKEKIKKYVIETLEEIEYETQKN